MIAPETHRNLLAGHKHAGMQLVTVHGANALSIL